MNHLRIKCESLEKKAPFLVYLFPVSYVNGKIIRFVDADISGHFTMAAQTSIFHVTRAIYPAESQTKYILLLT